MKVLILASDPGKKLWPLTDEETPKSFLPVYSKYSMLVETIVRIAPFVSDGRDIFIVVPEYTYEELDPDSINIPKENLILDVGFKDTFNAIRLGLLYLDKIVGLEDDETIMIIPADQYMFPLETFAFYAYNAYKYCKDHTDRMVCFVKDPFNPSTKFNYCKLDYEGEQIMDQIPGEEEDTSLVSVMAPLITPIEIKPITPKAVELINDNYYWMTGIYMVSFDLLRKIIKYHNQSEYELLYNIPLITKKIRTGWFSSKTNLELDYDKIYDEWVKLEEVEFDGLVSKYISETKINTCLGSDMEEVYWSRLDNWATIKHMICDSGVFNTSQDPELHLEESGNNYVFKPVGKHVALFGIKDLVIVDTDDCLLIGTPESLYTNL